jgi:hypothetical protein
MDMPGLALYIKQLTVTAHDALDATFATTANIRLLYPVTALIPKIVEAILRSDFRFCCTLHCHLLPLA